MEWKKEVATGAGGGEASGITGASSNDAVHDRQATPSQQATSDEKDTNTIKGFFVFAVTRTIKPESHSFFAAIRTRQLLMPRETKSFRARASGGPGIKEVIGLVMGSGDAGIVRITAGVCTARDQFCRFAARGA